MNVVKLVDSINTSSKNKIFDYFTSLFEKIENDNYYFISSIFLNEYFCFSTNEIFSKDNVLKILEDKLKKKGFIELKKIRDEQIKRDTLIIKTKNSFMFSYNSKEKYLSINDFCSGDIDSDDYRLSRNSFFIEISIRYTGNNQYSFIIELDNNHKIRKYRLGISDNNVNLFCNFFISQIKNKHYNWKLKNNKISITQILNKEISILVEYDLNKFKQILKIGCLMLEKPNFFIISNNVSNQVFFSYNSFSFDENIMFNNNVYETVCKFHTLLDAHLVIIDDLLKILSDTAGCHL